MNAANRRFKVGALAIALTLVFAGVALAAAKSGSYKGTTTQTGEANGTVRFSVSKDHKNVQKFSGAISATCVKSGTSQLIEITLNPTPDMKLSKLKFGFHGVFNITSGKVVIAKRVNGAISGKFVHTTKATGTMKFSWTFDKNAPQPFPGYKCSTGTVHYTAKHT